MGILDTAKRQVRVNLDEQPVKVAAPISREQALSNMTSSFRRINDSVTASSTPEQLDAANAQMRQASARYRTTIGELSPPTTGGELPPATGGELPPATGGGDVKGPKSPRRAGNTAAGGTSTTTPAAAPGPLDPKSYHLGDFAPSKESTVAGQIEAITGKNSGLMQRAKAAGLATAAARGLTNSSLAAGASQAAVYDRMLPIAQQDASTSGQFQLSERQYKQNLEQQAFQFKQQFERDKQQYGYQTALTNLQASIAAAAQQKAFENTGALNQQAFVNTSALNTQNAQLTIDSAYALHPLEMDSLKAQLDAQKQISQTGVGNTLTLGLADRLTQISADSTLTPAQQTALRQQAVTDFSTLAQYAGGIQTDLNRLIPPPAAPAAPAATPAVNRSPPSLLGRAFTR